MKKMFLLAGFLSGAMLLCASETDEKVVARWDFEKGLVSDSFQLQLRGDAEIVDDAEQGKVLSPGTNPDGAAAGAILRGVPQDALTPSGDFQLSMKLKAAFPEKFDKNLQMTLWDTKYAAKKGFNLNLILEPSGRVNLRVEAGYGDAEDKFMVRDLKIADGKWHTLAARLDGNILTLSLDQTPIGKFTLKGVPAGSAHRLSVGDRVGAGYGAFAGFIDDITLTIPTTK